MTRIEDGAGAHPRALTKGRFTGNVTVKQARRSLRLGGRCVTWNLTVKQNLDRGRFTGNMTVKQRAESATAPTEVEAGFLLGLLVGEGHFGGDGKQPQITLRMHTRHEGVFRWLERTFPGGRLYGPYHHGGRSYFQWMARGRYLREVLVPVIEARLGLLDGHARGRFEAMCAAYRIDPGEAGGRPPAEGRVSAPEQASEAEQDGGVVGDVGGDRAAEAEALSEQAEDESEQQDVEVRRRGKPVAGVLEVEARPEE